MLKKLIILLYLAVLIVMGAATFVEKANSTDYVHEHIYGAWWFVALWGLLALAGGIYYIIYIRKHFQLPSLLLHLSFLLILGGALQTYLHGFNGNIHLRQDYPESMMIEQVHGKYRPKQLPIALQLDSFEMKKDSEGRVTDYISRFTITTERGGKEHAEVSMNNIYKYGEYRFYQASYDDDLRGSVLSINHDYYGIAITYTGYFLLFLSFILLILRKQKSESGTGHTRKRQWWLAILVVLLTALWCLDYFVLDGSWREIPILRHPLLAIHVVTIILAYALLLIMAIQSAWWLIKNPAKKCASQQGKVGNGLILALGLLSAGIFIGAIWANVSWGNYWSWDAKETWALITLMVYAVPAHRRSLPVFNNPKVYHTYILLAFLCILMTYFGVNHFLTGMHSYA